MRFSIMLKSVMVCIFCVLVAASGVFLVAWHGMGEGFGGLIGKELDVARRVVEDTFKESTQSLLHEARLLAVSPELDAAARKSDTTALAAFAQNTRTAMETDFVLLVDTTGAVMASFPAELSGSLANHGLVQAALDGRTGVDVVRLDKVGLPLARPRPFRATASQRVPCFWARPL